MTLAWIGPITTGHSHQTYFGKDAAGREVMMISPALQPADQKPRWDIRFNDSSLRVPKMPRHDSLSAAQAQAEVEMMQPISKHGLAARLLSARTRVTSLFPGAQNLPDADLRAACELIAPEYPEQEVDAIFDDVRGYRPYRPTLTVVDPIATFVQLSERVAALRA